MIVNPHLTEKELDFIHKWTEETIQDKKEAAEKKMEKLKDNFFYDKDTVDRNWFDTELIYIKHPELVEFKKNPDHVSDPSDLKYEFQFGDQPEKSLGPKTNRDRIQDIWEDWTRHEKFETQEWKQCRKFDTEKYEVSASLRRCTTLSEELARINTILESRKHDMGKKLSQLADNLLKPNDSLRKKKKQKREDNNDDPRVKGIVVPYLGDEEYTSVILTRSDHGHFVLIPKFSCKDSEIVATLSDDGKLVIRGTDKRYS
jgi:hypothetical protein